MSLKKHPLLSSFFATALLLIYVLCVSYLMQNGEKLFGNQPDDIMAPIIILLLLVFSALICGILLLGGPIYLYFEGDKKTAIKMLFTNASFLAVMLLAAIVLKIIL